MDAKDGAGAASGVRLGRYAVVGTLGRGGMGEVLRARSFGAAGVAKELCVKRIHADRLASPGALARFVAEAKISLRLSHGNIVSVFDFGRADHEYYLAMEWVDGADLHRILDDVERRGAPLSPCAAAHVAAEVARALAYAHALTLDDAPGGVVHCDVKPANILVSRSGDVKLADFGVSTAVQGTGGTRGYMAPEQVEGRVAPASDVYALGVVLGEMLAGERPAPGEAPKGAPIELAELVARATNLDVAERMGSAAELADALEKLVARGRAGGARSPRTELAERADAIARARGARSEKGELVASVSFARDGESATLSELPTAVTASRRDDEPRSWIWPSAALALAIAIGVGVWASASAPWLDPASDPLSESVREATEREATEREATEREASSPLPAPSREATEPSDAPGTQIEEPRDEARELVVEAERVDLPRPASVRIPSPPTPAPELAHLRINAIPWAEVELDGRPIGTTPILDVEVSAGTHLLRFENPALGVERTREIDLAPGERRDLVVRLDESR